MAKYVCNYEQVTAIGNKLKEASNTLTDAVNTYSSSIDGSLSSWNGAAKKNFSSQSSVQTDKLLAKAEYISSLGQFIIDSANKIKSLDDELASIDI